jgi:uncharacterized protein DUF5989
MRDHDLGDTSDPSAFVDAAGSRRRSLPWEIWQFARQNKRWWIIPIVVALLLIGLLMLLGSTGVGSLIYPLF